KFKKKSEARLMELIKKGVTVLFVSHSSEQVRRICNKAIILEKGRMIASGDVNEVTDKYDSMTK
ncbi:MAG: ABC transporter ATP-binding protein, partial [Eubacterium sp.]|nr:ABC transporter ATP-binding protein [Eubacterium sp.]